jgi:cysteine desulfurase/selenocysteine lyase
MTIQTPTSNLAGAGLPSAVTDVGGATPQGLPDEATLTRLAAEFFSALPNANSNNSGFNFDLPNVGKPAHPPQSGETYSALSGRAPALAFNQGLNPEVPTHTPNTLDNPERRAIASAPVIGGANVPRPPFEPHAPHAADITPSVPVVSAGQSASQALTADSSSPFYFLNETQAVPNQSAAPTGNLFDDSVVAQSFNLPASDNLKSLLVDDRSKTSGASAVSSSASNFYFLDVPAPAQPTQHYTPSKGLPVHQAAQPLDVRRIRQDFPILQERVNGRPLVWLDNAATTHKPKSVIERIAYFYEHENSNIHRAAHELAARATDAYEHARNAVTRFLGAGSSKEIVFVRGTTEGINLIAKTYGKQNIGQGDEIIVSHLEHHANIVPWYQLAKEVGAKLRVIPVDDTGQIRLDEFTKLLNDRTKLVSITQVSNALGTVTPVAEVISLAHAKGVRVVVDGAQAVSHMPINVQALDADFYVFSGHKVFGPTGIGAVYAKAELLETMPVWEGGGNMIEDVTFESVIYQPAPNKFEAGTGNIADAVGLGAAIEYVESIGMANIARYEHDLLEYGQHGLSSVSGLRLIGTAINKASVMSFTLEGYSTEEVGKALNQHGIAVRSGHHCAQPILRRFGVEQTVRPSLAFYNTTEEIDLLVSVLHQLRRARSTRR